ncbi:MAG: glycosyltransferase family 4 protein [Clostridia bacterium]|nr:glycosyltransferase family 4 protein [Clostridia bacterium]
MKILHICIYFRNPMFMGLMEAQEKQNIEKRVFYYETRKIGLRKFNLSYVDSFSSNLRLLPSPYLRFLRLRIVASGMLKLYEQSHNFDCIHAHTLVEDGYLALQAKKAWGIPYIITVRDSDFHFKPFWRWKIYRKTIDEIIENAKSIVFLSGSAQNTFLKMLSEDILKKLPPVHIVPNGIDNFWHENRWIRKTDFRTVHDQWNVITVGKIFKRKNQVVTSEAIRQLRSEGYNIEYELVGRAEDKKMLREINDMGFVQIKGFMNKTELLEEYRKNDIFLLASTNESFGLVYAEAMSQGLPVIYTRGQGFDKQFEDGVVGFPVACDSVEDIKSAVLSVINNYNSLTGKCSELAAIFDWDRVAKKLTDVYLSAYQTEIKKE